MRSLTLAIAAVLVAAPAAPAAPARARGWLRPVEGPVLRAFSVGPDRFAAGQHRGVDLGAAVGTRVLAACDGRVTFAGRVPRGGRTVSVRCGPLVATYQHLGAVAVSRGQLIPPGAPIGTVGRARPHAHVHLGARDVATGAYRDPLDLFAAGPRAVPPPVVGPRRAPPLGHAPVPVVWRPLPRGPVPVPVVRRPLPRGPVPVPAVRRPLPRGPAPVPAVGRPLSLGPAPTPSGPAPRALLGPASSLRDPVELPATPPEGSGAGPLPWPVWAGLALIGLGLPLGGVVSGRRRRRRHAPAVQPWAASS